MDDKILLSSIEDKIRQSEKRSMVTNTGFLDMRQRSLADNLIKNRGIRHTFDGGYAEAERTVLVFLPEYVYNYVDMSNDERPITVLRAVLDKKAKPLTHRDYLGSLMALGIKRECIGDIIVRSDGADIVVLKEISDFLLMNYYQAGHTNLSVSEVALSEIREPEYQTKEKTDTVASLRLDNIVSTAFGGSRTAAAGEIKMGLVYVNNLLVEKTDYKLKEGDKIVLRGKGKALLKEVGGESRKNRIFVRIEKYI